MAVTDGSAISGYASGNGEWNDGDVIMAENLNNIEKVINKVVQSPLIKVLTINLDFTNATYKGKIDSFHTWTIDSKSSNFNLKDFIPELDNNKTICFLNTYEYKPYDEPEHYRDMYSIPFNSETTIYLHERTHTEDRINITLNTMEDDFFIEIARLYYNGSTTKPDISGDWNKTIVLYFVTPIETQTIDIK